VTAWSGTQGLGLAAPVIEPYLVVLSQTYGILNSLALHVIKVTEGHSDLEIREDSSVHFQRPQSEEAYDSAADTSVSLSPPILSPQVTSSETMRILASQGVRYRVICVADTMGT